MMIRNYILVVACFCFSQCKVENEDISRALKELAEFTETDSIVADVNKVYDSNGKSFSNIDIEITNSTIFKNATERDKRYRSSAAAYVFYDNLFNKKYLDTIKININNNNSKELFSFSTNDLKIVISAQDLVDSFKLFYNLRDTIKMERLFQKKLFSENKVLLTERLKLIYQENGLINNMLFIGYEKKEGFVDCYFEMQFQHEELYSVFSFSEKEYQVISGIKM